MNKADELALRAYPVREKTNKKGTGTYDPNLPRRRAYAEGFNRAVEAACQWLEARQVVDLEVPNIDTFIKDLRKDLESKDLGMPKVHKGEVGYSGEEKVTVQIRRKETADEGEE